jgi:hypothetical protein
MSRSALWRQEGNVKERERNAEELFLAAVEEGRVSCLSVELKRAHLDPGLLVWVVESVHVESTLTLRPFFLLCFLL